MNISLYVCLEWYIITKVYTSLHLLLIRYLWGMWFKHNNVRMFLTNTFKCISFFAADLNLHCYKEIFFLGMVHLKLKWNFGIQLMFYMGDQPSSISMEHGQKPHLQNASSCVDVLQWHNCQFWAILCCVFFFFFSLLDLFLVGY